MSRTRGNILLIDDDEVFSGVFAKELSAMGYTVRSGYGLELDAVFSEYDADIVVLDIVMPGASGLDLLPTIRRTWPAVDVIMLTGNATVENAVTSMKGGAYDYFTKPVELDRVEQILHRCMENRRLKSRNQMLKNKLSDLRECRLIGDSAAMSGIRALIARVADSDPTVLIHGESGTGKELVASAIHQSSPRRDEPFIIVDCTALNESLLESELFGHERGAFTGAVSLKHGIFEVAEGGTVFLDEIGDLPPALQVKLLRVVESRSFRRVGGNERIDVDVRLIAATNRDLPAMMRAGEFREDLYYRINVVTISLPPLRSHVEDIPLLVENFVAELRRPNDPVKHFSDDALEVLKQHDWPGNARELRNVVERALLLSDEETIEVEDVPLSSSPLREIIRRAGDSETPSLREIEDSYIRWVLEKTGGNRQQAARILDVDRKTILRRLGNDGNET